MNAHLQTAHPDKLEKKEQSSGQKEMLHFLKKKSTAKPMPMRDADRKEVDSHLQKFFVSSLAPIIMVDNKEFKNFVSSLNPRYNVPCAKNLMSKLKKEYEEMKRELKKDVQECEFVGITHDSWTSIATKSFETSTVHYIKETPITGEWKLKSKVLDTSNIAGDHSAEAIAKYLSGVKENWKLPQLTAVTDNAEVEKKHAEF